MARAAPLVVTLLLILGSCAGGSETIGKKETACPIVRPVTVSARAGAGRGLGESRTSQLSWLTGCWSAPRANTTVSECWLELDGGFLFGVNRTARAGKTTAFEYLRIEPRDDGLIYLASPNGRSPATAFKLTAARGQSAVFENPRHDFPRRIRYERLGRTLRVDISGVRDGKPARASWIWQRDRRGRDAQTTFE